MTYDDNEDLVKFTNTSFTKTVCPYDVPINQNQTKSFELSYDEKDNVNYLNTSSFFIDDAFCPILNFTLMKEDCDSKVDPLSHVTFDNETNRVISKRNETSGWDQVMCL